MKTIKVIYLNSSNQTVLIETVKRMKAAKSYNGVWNIPKKFKDSSIKFMILEQLSK